MMHEAIKAVLAFGFDAMALSEICAIPESGNPRSIRLLERLGFEFRPDLPDPEDLAGLVYTLFRPG